MEKSNERRCEQAIARSSVDANLPAEEAAPKLIFLAIRNFEKSSGTVQDWVAARDQLAIMFAGRFYT